MGLIEDLKTFELDTEKGICLINGTDVSKQCSCLKLEFDGEWSLAVTLDKCFSSMKNEIITEETLQ